MKLNLIVVMIFIEKNQTTHVDTIHWYKTTIKCLMYAMTIIKSNLTYALFVINRYRHNLDLIHVIVIQRIFQYF